MTAQELRAIRAALGLTQAQAARLVGKDVRTWARWESGKHRIPEGAASFLRLTRLPEVRAALMLNPWENAHD